MRILSWSLNHRGRVHDVPGWVVPAIEAETPDVLVCTDYVRGPRHVEFLAALRAIGLRHSDVTAPLPGSPDVVLVAARESLLGGSVFPPADSPPALRSGVAHAILQESGVHVLGFRMPRFGEEAASKRTTWEWLTDAIDPLLEEPAIVVGDFDTAPGAPRRGDADELATLEERGWRVAIPSDGGSRSTPAGEPEGSDFALVSPRLVLGGAEYGRRFRERAPDAADGEAGVPDRPMLLIEAERVAPADSAPRT